CDMRRPSTGSTQSLLMMNSDLLLEYSRYLAARLADEAGDDLTQQIQLSWQLVYSRRPEHSELDSATAFLNEQTAIFGEQSAYKPNEKKPPARTAGQEAVALMCQMLLSSNEFLYVD
ncbi:MAG TPA: DUF1553 domain-containing protein, partial [Planctomycetes bacterium]|nr:DUF1553 domain-containing protein [Planctomycetota bacterium]